MPAQTSSLINIPTTLADQNLATVSVVLIILITGVLGGWAAFLSQPQQPAPDQPLDIRAPWLRFIVLGTVASLCVPLFLSILKSELIASIFEQPLGPSSYNSYFVFAGICLIAAFSARRFMDTVTERLLHRVDQAQQVAQQAQASAADASAVANEAIANIEAADEPKLAKSDELTVENSDTAPSEDETLPINAYIITPTERKILTALQGRTYRTTSGIAEASGIPRQDISEAIGDLVSRKFVLPTKSPNTGGPRWTISTRGTRALNKYLEANLK